MVMIRQICQGMGKNIFTYVQFYTHHIHTTVGIVLYFFFLLFKSLGRERVLDVAALTYIIETFL